MTVGLLQPDRICRALRTTRIGRRIEYVEETTSTIDEAWKRADCSDFDGLVVLTEYQSAGRGRLGRYWTSPKGASLLCSVALMEHARADGNADSALTGGNLVLMSAVSACDAIRESAGVTATIKWPNDIMASGKKVGGILVETRSAADGLSRYVIGIGINCLQHAAHLEKLIDQPVTSLDLESSSPIDRGDLIVNLLTEMDRCIRRLQAGGAADLREAWLARAEPVGRPIRLRHAGRVISGTVVDVDPGAALVVQLDEGGIRAFDAATTSTLP